jgi:8-amino-7-oxononanoate synthase
VIVLGKIEKMNSLTDWERELALLENKSNLRKLPVIRHWGREVEVNGKVMLNLSSNDYLGLAAYLPLRTEFLQSLTPDTFLPSSSSSRLLTGNFNIYVQIEDLLARLFRKESALVFNSGYHMNAGILPAVSDARTLILADKLVHASIIDGIRLSAAKCIRYRHNRYDQLEQLLASNHAGYDRIIHERTFIHSPTDKKKCQSGKMLLLYKIMFHINSIRLFISSSVISAVNEKRMRDVPSGTVGGRTGNA